MYKFFLILTIIFVQALSDILINSTSAFLFQFQNGDIPDEIKIFPSGQKILLLYTDGLIRCIDLQTKDVDIWDAHRNSIIGVEWIPNHGLITLDKSGLAIRWSFMGVPQHKWQMGQKAFDISITVDRQRTYFVAFCLQKEVRQYKALEKSNVTTMVLDKKNASCLVIQHDMSHNYIYTQQWDILNPLRTLLRKYGCFDGKLIAQQETSLSIESLKPYSKNEILMEAFDLYSLYQNLTIKTKYSVINYYNMIQLCPNRLVIILRNQSILVLNDTQIQQTLYINPFLNEAKKIDCNQDYVAVYGISKYGVDSILLFKFYNQIPTPTPNPQQDNDILTYILIIGGGIFGLLAFIFLVVFIIKKCKQRKPPLGKINKNRQHLINQSQFQ